MVTAEGVFPKAGNDPVYASEVNSFSQANNIGATVFKNLAQTIFNADLIGFNANLDKEFINLKYETNPTGGTGDIKDAPAFSALVLDDFEDASFDTTNRWTITQTGGSVSESSGVVTLSTSAAAYDAAKNETIVGDGNLAPDLRNGNALSSCFIYVTAYSLSSATNGGSSVTISLTDGTNSVSIFTHERGGDGATTTGTPKKIGVQINPTGDVMTINTGDFNGTAGNTDISSLTNNVPWRIKINSMSVCSGGPGSASSSITVGFVRYLLNDPVVKTFISSATSASATNAILCVNVDSTYGSAIYYLSSNDGGNWEEVTPNQIHRFENLGDNLKFKASLTSTETLVYKLNHYAVFYNLY